MIFVQIGFGLIGLNVKKSLTKIFSTWELVSRPYDEFTPQEIQKKIGRTHLSLKLRKMPSVEFVQFAKMKNILGDHSENRIQHRN